MKPLVKPKALCDGDVVALVAPSSSLATQEEFEQAQRNVEKLGLKVKQSAHALDYWGYLAGTDENRAADLNAAFADPEVKGIICLRGGYGAGRIVDRLDYGLIRRNPKVLVGYSDITALLLALYAKAGVVSFHGPVAISTFGDFDVRNLTKAIKSTGPLGLLSEPAGPTDDPPKPDGATLRAGVGSGPLVGGNLSVLVSLLGSPYVPSFEGHLLFLEDVEEDPYRIDRMLNSLRLAGLMKGVQGIVFGDFSPRPAKPDAIPPDPARDFTMQQVLQNFVDQVRIPAYCGAWFGHIRQKLTVPVGVQAEMDADGRTLTVTESATQS